MFRTTYLPLSILVFWGLLLSGTEAASEEGESESSEATSGCYRPTLSEYEELFREAFTIKTEETGSNDSDVSIYINCMSFGSDYALKTAIVSGNASTTEQVLRFTCRGGVLLVLESQREFSTERNESCLTCSEESDSHSENACLIPCAEDCDRCYGTADACSCTKFLVYETSNIINDVRRLSAEEHIDEEIERVIKDSPLTECQEKCREHYYISEEGASSICYPCGVRFCAECHEEGEERECTACLPHTELFHEGEGECLFGLRAEILHVYEEQEEEVEEEEREKDIARIELAVSLPIVSVIVVAFFVFMSFVAHKRYPHIGETGKTRHRNKPPPVAEEEYAVDDSVFRPRPTVRLR